MDVLPSFPISQRRLGEHGVEQAGLAGDEDVCDEFRVLDRAGKGNKIKAFEEIEALILGAITHQMVEKIQTDAGGVNDVVVGIRISGEQRIAGEVSFGFSHSQVGCWEKLCLKCGRPFQVATGGGIIADFLFGDSEIVEGADQTGLV